MRQNVISIIAIAMLISGLSSCTIDDSTPVPVDLTTPHIVQDGTWRITLFDDSGEDETYHFTGYAFTFDSTGIISAIKDSILVNGIWNTVTDDNQKEIYIDFGTHIPFNDLNDDWDIIEKTLSKIRLEDISGGNEPNDYLTFEKN